MSTRTKTRGQTKNEKPAVKNQRPRKIRTSVKAGLGGGGGG